MVICEKTWRCYFSLALFLILAGCNDEERVERHSSLRAANDGGADAARNSQDVGGEDSSFKRGETSTETTGTSVVLAEFQNAIPDCLAGMESSGLWRIVCYVSAKGENNKPIHAAGFKNLRVDFGRLLGASNRVTGIGVKMDASGMIARYELEDPPDLVYTVPVMWINMTNGETKDDPQIVKIREPFIDPPLTNTPVPTASVSSPPPEKVMVFELFNSSINKHVTVRADEIVRETTGLRIPSDQLNPNRTWTELYRYFFIKDAQPGLIAVWRCSTKRQFYTESYMPSREADCEGVQQDNEGVPTKIVGYLYPEPCASDQIPIYRVRTPNGPDHYSSPSPVTVNEGVLGCGYPADMTP